MYAGTSTSSNEAKLIGIIVGVVIACALLLLILCCCWLKQRRKNRAAAEDAAAAKGVSGVEGKQDSVYVQGIKVNTTGSFDKAAVDSPEHKEKMKKLEAMNFQKTKSPRGQLGAGTLPYSPQSRKGFAFPDVVAQKGEAFGSPVSNQSPVYTPRGTNVISKLFSTKSGVQVSDSAAALTLETMHCCCVQSFMQCDWQGLKLHCPWSVSKQFSLNSSGSCIA